MVSAHYFGSIFHSPLQRRSYLDNREKNWEEKILARRNMELKQLKTTFLLEVGFNLLWQG
jgi:hypothetical protein